MKKEHRKTKDEIMRAINEAIPSKMSPQEALDFLDELASDIDGTCDGIRDDIKSGQGET